jgi:E3 ubiquitin-protein ligase SIAH1
MKGAFAMAPGSSIVTVVPESDCGDDGLSEALGSIRLDVDSTSKPWSSLANVALSSLSGLNDLLECPVCTNSMRPPILQVSSLSLLVCAEEDILMIAICVCLFQFECKNNADTVSFHCLLNILTELV